MSTKHFIKSPSLLYGCNIVSLLIVLNDNLEFEDLRNLSILLTIELNRVSSFDTYYL